MSQTIGSGGNALQLTIPTRGDVNWDYVMQQVMVALTTHNHDGLLNGAAITLATGSVINSKLGSMTNNTVKGNISGITTTPADVPLVSLGTAALTPSTLVARDANSNFIVNAVSQALATTLTGAGTTTLTVASATVQEFTGTNIQTVVLPSALTLPLGQTYSIKNRSTANVTVNTNGGATLYVLTPNTDTVCYLVTNGTAAGTWDIPQVGQIKATATNDNAAIGNVGEFFAISRAFGAPLALTTGTAAAVGNTTSISLTPGDWDIHVTVGFIPAATTSITQLQFGTNSTAVMPTSEGAPSTVNFLQSVSSAAFVPGANAITYAMQSFRVTLNTTTSIFLMAKAAFSVSTLSTYGYMEARRIR